MYRQIVLVCALLSAVTVTGCLDAVAPTPTSAVVSITPVNRSTRGDENELGSRFNIDIRIRNLGSRTIFLDRLYARTEKLIDQEWELALEPDRPVFGSIRTIQPGQSFTLTYSVFYVRATMPRSVHLEHVRGLYRARFRLSFTASDAELLAPEDSYSQPFAVE